MIYNGIGLNEETVIRYFDAAKSAMIGKKWITLFREYIVYCLYSQDFQPMRYCIVDPFVRSVVISNAVMFQVDFVESAALGKIKSIRPLPRGIAKEILQYPLSVWPNSAYTHIVGLLPSWEVENAPDTREAIRRAVGK